MSDLYDVTVKLKAIVTGLEPFPPFCSSSSTDHIKSPHLTVIKLHGMKCIHPYSLWRHTV